MKPIPDGLPRRRCTACYPGTRSRCIEDAGHVGDHFARRGGAWARQVGDPVDVVPCICEGLVGPAMGAKMRRDASAPDLAFLLVPANGLNRLGTGEGGVIGRKSWVHCKDMGPGLDYALLDHVHLELLPEDARWLRELLSRVVREERDPVARQLLQLLPAAAVGQIP